MTVDPALLNIILSVVGSVFAILMGVNAFFISRLVTKVDEAYKAATAAEVKVRGIDRIIREITELKTDMQLFKFIMTNNLGVKLPEKKEE